MSKETDISLISKYLNGKLDAKAMHQMEKRALDDPFLMDALEGYEISGKSQENELADIADRLKKRTEEPVKRIIPLRYFAIAASVLIVATVGGILVFKQKDTKPQLAKVVTPVTEKTTALPGKEPVVNNEIAAASPARQKTAGVQPTGINHKREEKSVAFVAPVAMAEERPAAPPKMAADETADKDTTPLNEMIVTEYTSGKKKDISQNLVATNLMKIRKADTAKTILLQGQVNGVASNNVSAQHPAYGYNLPVASAPQAVGDVEGLRKESVQYKSTIKGRVVAADGSPMQGATVKVAGTGSLAHTDNNGFFSIPADSTKATLIVGSLGYQTRNIKAGSDSAKNISLYPGNNSLSEVAIAGPVGAKRSALANAHPKKGWESFRKYLDENAVSPDKKTGVVSLSFLIDLSGVISNIQVIHGLSDATNQKAIYLISNGPAWIGSDKPEKVEVKIRFDK